MPRGFSVAICVLGVSHGIGDVVHVAGEWVTHETVRAVEIPVGITHQGHGRWWRSLVIAAGADRLAGLVIGLEEAVGIAGPAHSVGNIFDRTAIALRLAGVSSV